MDDSAICMIRLCQTDRQLEFDFQGWDIFPNYLKLSPRIYKLHKSSGACIMLGMYIRLWFFFSLHISSSGSCFTPHNCELPAVWNPQVLAATCSKWLYMVLYLFLYSFHIREDICLMFSVRRHKCKCPSNSILSFEVCNIKMNFKELHLS